MTNTQREVERWRYLSEYHEVREQDGIVTGVMSGNDVKWEYMPYDWTCIDCEAAHDAWLSDGGNDETEQDFFDGLECSGHTHLYGDWCLGIDGKYSVDENGEYGYAAIYNSNENTMQVVHSKIARWTEWCSPCYPHQGNVEEDSPLISGDRPWHPVSETTSVKLINIARELLVAMFDDTRELMRGTYVNLIDQLLYWAERMANNERISLDMYGQIAHGRVIEDRVKWRMSQGWESIEQPMSAEGVVKRINAISPTLAYEIADREFGIQNSVAAYSLPITSEEWELLDWMIENYKEGE